MFGGSGRFSMTIQDDSIATPDRSYRNVSLRANDIEALKQMSYQLSAKLRTRVTLSDTVRLLLDHYSDTVLNPGETPDWILI